LTIVIPYRAEVHNGLELKFALRSIEKYLSGWDKIFVLSNQYPKYPLNDYDNWETQNFNGLNFIYAEDFHGKKDYSIMQKMALACRHAEISDDFLMYHDDHMTAAPINVSSIKYWHNGSLSENLANSGSAHNRQSKANTLELMPDALHFDIHTPIIFNKERFLKTFQNLESRDVCVKSVYSNSFDDLEKEFMSDCRINGNTGKIDILSMIRWRTFFSTGTGISTPVVQVLKELYPEKSRFEL